MIRNSGKISVIIIEATAHIRLNYIPILVSGVTQIEFKLAVPVILF